MNTLTCDELRVGYGHVPVLDVVSFEINGGEWVHFYGKNGAGKSTLLKVFAALKNPISGRLLWNEDPVDGILRQSYRRKIRYFGHERALFQDLTVQDNWDLYSSMFNLTGASHSSVVGEVSPNRTVGNLSRGERQRVELAGLWPSESSLLILDEPFSSLDAHSQSLLEDFLRETVEDERLVITASPEPISASDRLFHVRMEGTVEEE